MPTRHAILGPSSARKWITCAPSARFEEQIYEAESPFAREGTIAHELAALQLLLWLDNGRNEEAIQDAYADALALALQFYQSGAIEDVGDPELAVAAMQRYTLDYAEYVYSLGGEILVEEEYDLSKFVPLSFGTADGVNLHPDVIFVSDLKFGKGLPVSAFENWQLMLYALGALLKAIERGYRPERMVLSIVQPRIGPPSVWEVSVKDLLLWAEVTVAPAGALAIAGQGDFIAGKHCQFCRARTSCKAWYDLYSDVADVMDKRQMTASDRALVLENAALVKSWLNKVEEEAVRDLQLKKPIPGFKLIRGSGQSAYLDENDIIEALIAEGYDSDDFVKSEVIGLTALRDLVGPKRFKAVFEGLTYKKEGKPKIVPLSDPAPAIGASAADDYELEDLT